MMLSLGMAIPATARGAALGRFQSLARLPTVSCLDGTQTDWPQFERFAALLEELYPDLRAALEREAVAGHALLYRWPGAARGPAAVLMAHYDVVGVSGEGWRFPPFSATVTGRGEDAEIWGRGVIDDKASLTCIFEAAEAAVLAGFVPAHDVYLALSHNEEILGDGTPAIVARLAQRGVPVGFVLDEGGIVGESIFAGLEHPVIFVGVSEKGTVTARLSCAGPGGHASVPPALPATVRLARAVLRLSERPPGPFFNEVTRRMLLDIAPYASGELRQAAEALRADDERSALAHFERVSRDAYAMVRTTPVATMLTAGHAVNVVPARACAVINARVAAGSSVRQALADMAAAIDDPEVGIEVVESFEPSPVSPSSGPCWDLLTDAITWTYGDVPVTPYVNNGGTDSRNYAPVCPNIYRFSPFEMTLDERRSIHAADEHIRVRSFYAGIEFYRRLISHL